MSCFFCFCFYSDAVYANHADQMNAQYCGQARQYAFDEFAVSIVYCSLIYLALINY